MPIVKRFQDMQTKYYLKYDGDNVTAALTAVKELMDARYEGAQSVIYNFQFYCRDTVGLMSHLRPSSVAFNSIVEIPRRATLRGTP